MSKGVRYNGDVYALNVLGIRYAIGDTSQVIRRCKGVISKPGFTEPLENISNQHRDGVSKNNFAWFLH